MGPPIMISSGVQDPSIRQCPAAKGSSYGRQKNEAGRLSVKVRIEWQRNIVCVCIHGMSACRRVHMQASVSMPCVSMRVLYRNIKTLSANVNNQVWL